ncbi:MAG: hypothetical protein K8R39_10805 [Arcobacteraceae bacterium]|nr:hypothetical protein [Arcobacteraceae bacterium]
MNHKHFKQILISNNILPKTMSETKLGLKLIKQKEKFILEDGVKALKYNKNITSLNGNYSLEQYLQEIQRITNQYYFLYIQISQFEAFLRTYINHKMVKVYGNRWHKNSIMSDLKDFNSTNILRYNKPSQVLNSISFGTLELVFLSGSRYANVFQKDLNINKILAKNGKPKYHNKDMLKDLFQLVRNARNDICHHRRIGESIKSNPKYKKKKMTKSDVLHSLNDLKILLGYDDTFDVKDVKLQYGDIAI